MLKVITKKLKHKNIVLLQALLPFSLDASKKRDYKEGILCSLDDKQILI